MNIQKDISLADYSTMRLGGKASHLVDIASKNEVEEALRWAKGQDLDTLMIGGGSNIVWRDEGFSGLLLVNRIKGFTAVVDGDSTLVTIGAGENWDEVVGRCTKLGLSGIECLSLIPGTAGATPIQNVGAYGQEISKVITKVEAYDSQSSQFVELAPEDCGFTYRSSRFRDDPSRFYITSITLRLTKTSLQPPFYQALQSYLSVNTITDYSPSSIRQAVIAIRNQKLPNPAEVHNCGSFFANPLISSAQLDKISSELGVDIPHWPTSDGLQKVAAGWLIENIGYKGYHDPHTGMATWPSQALVLVNENASSTADLLKFRDEIAGKVKAKFNIDLVQEPLLLPTIAR
jgi:UDP-N-acetylmuramate dehydrogenase